MELSKYGKLAEKYLKENKHDKYDELVKNNELNSFLIKADNHLCSYATLIEFELREDFPFPDNKDICQIVDYIKNTEKLVCERVMREIEVLIL